MSDAQARKKAMTNHGKRSGERGVALLVAVFALLLLSAIGMTMMFSANTETTINANYREKQIATYAALAGLQEAKDRLIAATGDIEWPTDLPDPAARNIIYIINPTGVDDVRPWHWQNDFADSELCHENTLGLATVAIAEPCLGSASLPNGGSWYEQRDNSDAAYTGPYKLNPPLAYKWTRIQLKANNNTPFPATGNSASGVQMCWNGLNQIPRPAGYTTQCIPNGAITSIVMTNNGSNYSSVPTVTLPAPPDGVQATARAILSNPSGVLSGIVIDDGGSGYTTPPTVVITDASGSGSGASATAVIAAEGAGVSSLALVDTGNPNTGCWKPPVAGYPTLNLSFSGGGGAGAAGTATLTSTHNCIADLKFTSGTCSASGANFTITTDNGFTATVGIPSSKKLTQATVSITNPGSGFNTGSSTTSPAITFTGVTCSSVVASATMGYTLASVNTTPTSSGAGYTSVPTVGFGTTTQYKGSTPLVRATLGAISSGVVTGFTNLVGGTGYTAPGAVHVTLQGGCATNPCPTVAQAHALFNGQITEIQVIEPGSGYRSVPIVTITGGGSPSPVATAVARIQGGTYYSPVMLLTSLGVSPNGARTMAQMEVAPAIQGLSLPGALTLAGPHPTFGAPNSYNFMIDGTDHPNGFVDPHSGATAPAPASCDATVGAPHPAIGAFDNPNLPTSPTSVQTIMSDIPAGRAGTNYPGLQASPDVQNVYGALGDQGTTPSGLDTLVNQISGMPGVNTYTATSSSSTDPPIDQGVHSVDPFWGSATRPAINVVNGDLEFTGSNIGYGILVVTGNLTFRGNPTWNGFVLVIGKGGAYFSGGGGGTINGSVFVAKTRGPNPTFPYLPGPLLENLDAPTLDWSGGGGNGIYYDHCWADAMLNMIPFSAPDSARPLTVLSLRTLAY
jgi:hypothetical protein